jgi:hypothetical protein
MITESEFSEKAQTGDLLLFRSVLLDQKIWPGKDSFDHISLLVRYNNDQIYLFEASCLPVSESQYAD